MSDEDEVVDGRDLTCPGCGADGLEEGYLEDQGEGSTGFARWVLGPTTMGRFGRAKVDRSRKVWRTKAMRCPRCRLLSLYTTNRT